MDFICKNKILNGSFTLNVSNVLVWSNAVTRCHSYKCLYQLGNDLLQKISLHIGQHIYEMCYQKILYMLQKIRIYVTFQDFVIKKVNFCTLKMPNSPKRANLRKKG